MDKCSSGQSYLTVDKHGKVSLRSLSSLESSSEADWKSFNPPKKYNHREFRFWQSGSTGKCLTVLGMGGKSKKRTVGVSDCKFDGSNPFQLFAFRFHYHFAFCCCGIHNQWLNQHCHWVAEKTIKQGYTNFTRDIDLRLWRWNTSLIHDNTIYICIHNKSTRYK